MALVRDLRPLGLLTRPYRLPASPFEVTSEDGVRLSGHRVGGGSSALVFCHGFSGWHRKPNLMRFQEELARSFAVFAFDLRGHGRSGGECTFGVREYLDVDAVVRLARQYGAERVVTFGASMGGISVVRHGALLGGVDAVVVVSTPARWNGHDSDAVRKMLWLAATDRGRRLLRACGVRTCETWERAEEPAEVVGRVAPAPLLIVHGRDDHYFDEEEAWLLYRRAREPKRLLLANRFGHAEDGFTPSFARQVTETLDRILPTAPARPGRRAAGRVGPAGARA